MSVTITAAILCEDIRNEINNKNTLVGVYSGNIWVAELPAKIRLAVYYEGKLDKPGKISSEIKMEYADAPALLGRMQHDVSTEFMSSSTPTLDLSFDKEGDFVVSVKFEGEDWREIIRRSVSLNKAIASPSNEP